MNITDPREICKPRHKFLPMYIFFIINTVLANIAEGSVGSDGDITFLPSNTLEGTKSRRTNIFQMTQNIVYSSVLDVIQNVLRNSTLPKPNPFSRREAETEAEKVTAIIQTNRNEQGPNRFFTVSVNDTVPGGEYFLGYSNNMFGGHTKYIEARAEPDYYTQRENQSRRKRSVLHLYNMVLCATGCNPLSYKGYGCYCGFLGSGFVVDGIDRCCKIHDWCYDTAGCPMFLEYFIPYLWKCYNHHYPLCAIDHGEFGGPGSCAQRLCECDRQLAQCLRAYPCPTSKALCTSSPWRLLQNILMN